MFSFLFSKVVLMLCTLFSMIGNIIYLLGCSKQGIVMLIVGRVVAGFGMQKNDVEGFCFDLGSHNF
jgi:hypothetical protein